MKLLVLLLSSILLTAAAELKPNCHLFRSDENGVQKIHYQCGVVLPSGVLADMIDRRRGTAASAAGYRHLQTHLEDSLNYRPQVKWQGVYTGFDGKDEGWIGARIESIPGTGLGHLNGPEFEAFADDIKRYYEADMKTLEVHAVQDAFAVQVDENGDPVEYVGGNVRERMRTSHRGSDFCKNPVDLRQYVQLGAELSNRELHFVDCPNAK